MANILGLENPHNKFFDGTPLATLFDPEKDANFLTRLFPRDKIIFVNPPYYDCHQFILRCFILFAYFGLNVILLCPQDKFDECKLSAGVITPVVRRVPLIGVTFRGYSTKDKPISGIQLYFFLQPNFTDLMEARDKHYQKLN
jgi:hypothetical protein